LRSYAIAFAGVPGRSFHGIQEVGGSIPLGSTSHLL